MFDFNIGFTSCHEQSDNNNWVNLGRSSGRTMSKVYFHFMETTDLHIKSSQDWLRRLGEGVQMEDIKEVFIIKYMML